MTERIATLTPSLYLMGEYIQEHVLQGYRLMEGSPSQYGWQYEVAMERDDPAQSAPVVEAPKKQGRPAKAQ